MAYRVEITLRLPISLVFRIVSSLGVSELLSLSLGNSLLSDSSLGNHSFNLAISAVSLCRLLAVAGIDK